MSLRSLVIAVLLAAVVAGVYLLLFVKNENGGPSQAAAGAATDAGGHEARGDRAATEGPAAEVASAGLTGVANRAAPRLPNIDKNENANTTKAPPRAPTADQVRVAQAIGQLYNSFDPSLAAEIFSKSPSLAEEPFVWMRASLGECGDGEPMNVANEFRARYIYQCERGHLEAGFEIDDETGKIPGMFMGARGVPLESAVAQAADAVMRLFNAWDTELYRRTFNEEKFDMEEVQELFKNTRAEFGACTLGEPDLVGARGGLIGLNCELAPRLMKIELELDDDRIRILWIDKPRPGR